MTSFSDEKIKAKRGLVASPRPQSTQAVQVSTLTRLAPKLWLHATRGLLHEFDTPSPFLTAGGNLSLKGGLKGRSYGSANLAQMCQPQARAIPDTP